MTCPRSHRLQAQANLRALPQSYSTSPLSSRQGLMEVWMLEHSEGRFQHSQLRLALLRLHPQALCHFCSHRSKRSCRRRQCPQWPWGTNTITRWAPSSPELPRLGGWGGSRAGRGSLVTPCPLPTECPGRLGDHLAAAGSGGTVEGCGRGCAPGHGRIGRPAGHLHFCQGLGAGATGEGPGTTVPTHMDTQG